MEKIRHIGQGGKWIRIPLWLVSITLFLLGLTALGLLADTGILLPLLIGVCVVVFWKIKAVSLGRTFSIGGFMVGLSVFWYLSLRPSNDRDWMDDFENLPRFEMEGSELKIAGLRDFRWKSDSEFEKRWVERTYDLNKSDSLELIVEPFGDSRYAAHAMLGFGFSDGQRLVVSVEARREKGERYSLPSGALRKFELVYVFATEEDIIDLRAVRRKSRVFAFPVRSDCEFRQRLLLDLCKSANALHEEPKFYATLRDNCATTLLKHANRILDEDIGLQKEILFPARLGDLLYRLNLMDTSLPLEEALARFRIDEKARRCAGDSRFSQLFRE